MTAPFLATGKFPFTTGFDIILYSTTGTSSWNAGDSTHTINGSWYGQTPNTCAQEVIGRFEVKNGAGLFCSSTAGLTRRVEFTIDTSGEQPIAKLRAVGMSSSAIFQGNMNLWADAPLPETITVNSMQTFSLILDDQGWKVIYKHPVYGDRILLEMDINSVSTFATTSVYSDLMNVANNTYAGFFSVSDVKVAGLLINTVGVRGNPRAVGSSGRIHFSDNFDRAAQNPYNPVGATYTAPANGGFMGAAGTGPPNWVELDGANNLVMRAAVTNRVLVGTTASGSQVPGPSDMEAQYVKVVYDSGKPGLYFSGVLRHIYFNSSIDGAVIHSITVETNGTK